MTRDAGEPAETGPMIITGERTVPGVWHENYWFRRHEVVYAAAQAMVEGRDVLDAGCGEGYGAAMLAERARLVHALDYDDYAVTHVRRTYPALAVVRGNLAGLPLADEAYDVVVSLQTIEHLWNQDAFVAECVRVLRPGGLLVLSTPNTLTFPPGNLYHPHELTASELAGLVGRHAAVEDLAGLHHSAALTGWESTHGSLVDAQIAAPYDDWPAAVSACVRAVRTDDFVLRGGDAEDLDASLDLVLVARRAAATTGG